MDVIELEIKNETPDLFLIYMKENFISMRLLAEGIGIQPSYLNRMLTKQYPLTKNIKQKMNELLKTNF